MASPTAVNDQVTDSVTQTSVTVMAESPAIALSSQILSSCQAHALMAYNAVYAQQKPRFWDYPAWPTISSQYLIQVVQETCRPPCQKGCPA